MVTALLDRAIVRAARRIPDSNARLLAVISSGPRGGRLDRLADRLGEVYVPGDGTVTAAEHRALPGRRRAAGAVYVWLEQVHTVRAYRRWTRTHLADWNEQYGGTA